jgi:inorganic pyrophosphatase
LTRFFLILKEKDGNRISPWHDIPLVVNPEKRTYNFVLEIPKGTNAKLEICLGEEHNPIKQDVKNGKLRYVADVHGNKGYPWNYGAFPQTWEDPDVVCPETGTKGDRDPVDVCEIGQRVGKTGEVREVKILGLLSLIDEGISFPFPKDKSNGEFLFKLFLFFFFFFFLFS